MRNFTIFIFAAMLFSACNFDPRDFFRNERPAEFPGGQLMLNEYLSQNLSYPDQAVEEEIEGKVYIRFVVNEDGHVSGAEVVNKAHYLLDREALRVVRKMPPWIPAKINGKAVKSSFNIPITFKLQ